MKYRIILCAFLLSFIIIDFNSNEVYSSNVDSFWRGYQKAAEANRAQQESLAAQERLRQEEIRTKEMQLQRDMYMYEQGFCPKRGGCSRQYVPCDSPDAERVF